MSPLRQRRPRKREPKYLEFIAALPCVICLTEPVECAHVRFTEPCQRCHGLGNFVGEPCQDCEATGYRYGKRPVGAGEKPSDRWTLPLCPTDHRNGKNAQHNCGEQKWWEGHGIDPLELCTKFQGAYNLAPSRVAALDTASMILVDTVRKARQLC